MSDIAGGEYRAGALVPGLLHAGIGAEQSKVAPAFRWRYFLRWQRRVKSPARRRRHELQIPDKDPKESLKRLQTTPSSRVRQPTWRSW